MTDVKASTFKIIEKPDGYYMCLLNAAVNRNNLEANLSDLGYHISSSLLSRLFQQEPGAPVKIESHQELDSRFLDYVKATAEKTAPFIIDISRDQMRAYLTVSSYYYGSLSVDALLQELERAGISYGIDGSTVETALHNTEEKVLVAIGRKAVHGKDGSIIYHYREPLRKPVLTPEGTVDYYELGYITPIHAGKPVADRVPATKGEPGMNVLGKELPAREGKTPDFKVGKGVIITENKAVAEFDGALAWVNNRISITKMLIIKGDVDFSVGNLDFLGKIMIAGSVKEGFHVQADDDIEIRGGVENAQVTSRRGSVFIHKGVIGRGNAIIKAGKNIEARFAQGMLAEAGLNIIVNEYILRCHLKAGDSVLIHGRKGRILGDNSIYARTRIKASRVQNCKTLDLQVEGIERRQFYQQIKDLNKSIEHKEFELRVLSDQIRKCRDNLVDLQTVMQLEQKLPEYIQLSEEYDYQVEARNSLVNMLKNTRGEGMIEIGAGLEAGMSFSIKQEPLKLRDKLRNINMYYDPDEQRIIVLDASR